MSELKTLKDMKNWFNGANSSDFVLKCVKEEAIKWVKEEIKAQVFSGISEANQRWKERFNITEGDLI